MASCPGATAECGSWKGTRALAAEEHLGHLGMRRGVVQAAEQEAAEVWVSQGQQVAATSPGECSHSVGAESETCPVGVPMTAVP